MGAGLHMVISLLRLLLIFWLFLSIVFSRPGFGVSVLVCGRRAFILSGPWRLRKGSHVGHAGVGIVSLSGSPVAVPSSATTAFQRYFDLGRLVHCVLPLGNGRLMHLVVAYGFQGADEDAEKLSLPDQLFDAAMCELGVVSRGRPRIIAGDFNVEPTTIPCLLKGISVGLWIDLQSSWSRAAGVGPDVTCKRDWACHGGTRRDFVLGYHLAAAAFGGCWVDCCRWISAPSFCVCVFCGCSLVCSGYSTGQGFSSLASFLGLGGG